MKDISESKRESLMPLIRETLKEETTEIIPVSISCLEDSKTEGTQVSFSFEERAYGKTKTHTFEEVVGSGFVDCVFSACHNLYRQQYKSLENIKLVDLLVKPLFFSSRTTTNSDAKTKVVLKVEIKKHGEQEFYHKSRSIIHSSFVSILSAFEFYVNCEKSFHKLRVFIEEARNRNRSDLAQVYVYKISELTRYNNYEY